MDLLRCCVVTLKEEWEVTKKLPSWSCCYWHCVKHFIHSSLKVLTICVCNEKTKKLSFVQNPTLQHLHSLIKLVKFAMMNITSSLVSLPSFPKYFPFSFNTILKIVSILNFLILKIKCNESWFIVLFCLSLTFLFRKLLWRTNPNWKELKFGCLELHPQKTLKTIQNDIQEEIPSKRDQSQLK